MDSQLYSPMKALLDFKVMSSEVTCDGLMEEHDGEEQNALKEEAEVESIVGAGISVPYCSCQSSAQS